MNRGFAASIVLPTVLLAGCSAPYMARAGPLTPCDTTAEPFSRDIPTGVCRRQIEDYRAFLSQLGYLEVTEDNQYRQYRRSLHRWERSHADTTDVITVEFATSYEGAVAVGIATGSNVLRIHVSGRSYVEAGGKRRGVRDTPVLRRDVQDLVEYLRDMFGEAQRRD